MKELSVEQKAKAYDEAINKAKSLYKAAEPMSGCKVIIETLFSELAESDDERIRESLLEYLHTLPNHYAHSGVCAPEWITWLEKQGDKDEEILILKDQIESLHAAIKVIKETYKIELEKQGEQKSTLPKWKYKKDNTPLLRDSLILNKYGCVAKSPSGAIVGDVWVIDYDELAKLPKEEFEKQGEQKPIDKVEPKFKIGDTITDPTDSTFTFHINAIKDGKYMESDKDWVLIKEADNDYELVEQKPAEWDDDAIAKLADEYEETLIKESNMSENMAHHCRLAFIHGADAMLKKTQCKQKLAWSEDDDEMLQQVIADIEDLIATETGIKFLANYHRHHDWLHSLKDRVQPQPRQEWSEEDETGLTNTTIMLKEGASLHFNKKDITKAVNWLKSLKDRVQPKVELTQLDKNILEATIAFVEQNNHFNCWGGVDKQTVLSALRSLRPQNRWKPSDEQIMALRWVLNHMFYDSHHKEEISGLLEQLKKLREE